MNRASLSDRVSLGDTTHARCATWPTSDANNCAARVAARGATRAAERQLIDLPPDALSLVLYQLTLAHDILQWRRRAMRSATL